MPGAVTRVFLLTQLAKRPHIFCYLSSVFSKIVTKKLDLSFLWSPSFLNLMTLPYLRKALFQAALVAAFHEPVFSAFYQKKRAEGKHHLTAIGAVAHKLCNVIFAVLKNNQPYRSQNLWFYHRFIRPAQEGLHSCCAYFSILYDPIFFDYPLDFL